MCAVVWLLLGSAMNYAQAVAFSLPASVALTGPATLARNSVGFGIAERGPVMWGSWVGGSWAQRMDTDQPTPTWCRIDPPSMYPSRFSTQVLAGWPAPALTGVAHDTDTGIQTVHLLLYDSSRPTLDAIPLAPLWPGFFLNALIWGSPVLLIPAAKGLRRSRRRRRGLCPRCAYDVRTGMLPACPECGSGAANRA